MAAEEPPRPTNQVRVSSQRPLFFYVSLGKRLLKEFGEVQFSGLGFAVSTLVTVVELLKKDGLATELKVSTSLEALEDDGQARTVHKPKLAVSLGKTPEFDAIMEKQAEAAAARKAANAGAVADEQ